MRRTALFLAFVLAVGGAVFFMREATQNRPDAVQAGTTTTIDFTVDTHRFQRGEPAAATALWAICSSTVDGTISPLPEASGDRWQVTVSPAIGEHGENRLVGCLEDVTVDRVLGNVVALRSDR